uniref:Uncharacterized protein n=1 Tax=viral metagenome TaxID=1070528 RepID=A0A6C0IUV6_9ZZZZ
MSASPQEVGADKPSVYWSDTVDKPKPVVVSNGLNRAPQPVEEVSVATEVFEPSREEIKKLQQELDTKPTFDVQKECASLVEKSNADLKQQITELEKQIRHFRGSEVERERKIILLQKQNINLQKRIDDAKKTRIKK